MVLAVLGLIALLSGIGGSNQGTQAPAQKKVDIPPAGRDRIARRIASKYGGGPFRSSLDMKEQFDSLLTPAFLVQEALCEDTVLTYPTE